jgi:hypothetical protein
MHILSGKSSDPQLTFNNVKRKFHFAATDSENLSSTLIASQSSAAGLIRW